jgi:hypothetical protein
MDSNQRRIMKSLIYKDKGIVTEAANVYNIVKQNYIRVVDEFTKSQPQYTQSISNLQF